MNFIEQLKSIVGEENLKTDKVSIQTFGQDWSKLKSSNAIGIIFPKDTSEVSKILRFANDNNISIVPSGGRTGLSGGAIAYQGELVLSLKRLNSIGKVDLSSLTLRCSAGAITEEIHNTCKPFQLTWPLDFASVGSSQIGGNLATNAGGVHVVHYGNTRDWVQSIEVVTMDGEIHEFNGDLIKNNSGYDFRHLFIGSEGTLGIITAATLKLTHVPKASDVIILSFKEFANAFKMLTSIRQTFKMNLYAFEYFSEKCLQKVKVHHKKEGLFQETYPHYILIEVLKEDKQSSQHIEQWVEEVFNNEWAQNGVIAQSEKDKLEFWSYRELISESLSATGRVHKNDVSVPISKIPEFLKKLNPLIKETHSEIGVFIFGHLGDGNLHINFMKPESWSELEFVNKVKSADNKMFSLLKHFQGSISAEHGVGILKKPFLQYSRSPFEISLMKAIKKECDPKGLLNPGKIFDNI